MTLRFQAVVVGMGPAGMAAAIELGRSGVRTALIDQAPLPAERVSGPTCDCALTPQNR
jgi:2-polyprenyl-6-methoxyphenol hydroxylase-like FAD-dependent oxidoreductase